MFTGEEGFREAEGHMKVFMGLIIFPLLCVCHTSLEKPKTIVNVIIVRSLAGSDMS